MSRSLFLLLLMGALGGFPVRAQGALVYRNDFESGSASLEGWQRFGPGPVAVEAGELTLRPARFDVVGASLDLSRWGVGYASVLKQNPGPVSWSFNLSNQDGAVNNGFAFVLAGNQQDPTGLAAVGYALSGGGNVGNRMLLWRFDFGIGGGGSVIVDIPDAIGLGTLPEKGTFRVSYDPAEDRWSVYGSMGVTYDDPAGKLRLLGQGLESGYTGRSLPYLSLAGTASGVDRFDNVQVNVVPEPGVTLLLVAGAGILGWARTGRRRW